MLKYLPVKREHIAVAPLPGTSGNGSIEHRGNMPMGKYLKDQRGFTMAELIVAVALMAIGLFALVGVQIVALNKTNIAYRLTTASALAESVLEDAMSWDNSDPRLKSTTALTSGFTIGSSPYTVSNVPYAFSCTFTQNAPISGMTTVQVNVNGGGRNMTITAYRRVL